MKTLWLIMVPVALALLWLYLIFPGKGKKAAAFRGCRIAHRGLHGGAVIENTLPAFAAAVEGGFGIELDVQLSSDGVAVVCHDADLERVFGIGREVGSMTAGELQEIGVPALSEVLALIDGRVPLVVELKGENTDVSVCVRAAALLDGYRGLFCVESFNPFNLRWFKRHRPQVIRGQLSSRFPGKKRPGRAILCFVLRHLITNFLCRPDFISYEHRYGGALSLRICGRLGADRFAWTIPSEEEEREAERQGFTAFIFEGYLPQPHRSDAASEEICPHSR